MQPRPSILAMFDPLNLPGMSREVVSDSEKENATPTKSYSSGNTLTMTAFFTRTYKSNIQTTQPTFRQRLVDIGEVTVDEASILSLGLDELKEEADDVDDFEDEDEADTTVVMLHGPSEILKGDNYLEPVTPKPAATRVPLAEIAFDNDCTPILRANPKPYAPLITEATTSSTPIVQVSLEDEDTSSLPEDSPPGMLDATVEDTRLNASTSVVVEDVANGAATSDIPLDSDDVVPTGDSAPETPATFDIIASASALPEITVSPPHSPPPSTIVLAEPPILEAATDDQPSPGEPVSIPDAPNSSQLAPRPRPRLAGAIEIDDPRRCSVDLQQSFCLQMQCPDSSFDLLNDKISFLANAPGMETFFEEDEDSFTLNAKTMPGRDKMTKRIELGESSHAASSEAYIPEDFIAPPLDATSMEQTETSEPPTVTPPTSPKGQAHTHASQNVLTPELLPGMLVDVSASDDHSLPTYVPSATPKPIAPSLAPPPIHALRIVKRSKLQRPEASRVPSHLRRESLQPLNSSASRTQLTSAPPDIPKVTTTQPLTRPPRSGYVPPRPPLPKLSQGASTTSSASSSQSGILPRSTALGRTPASNDSRSVTGASRLTRAVTSPSVPSISNSFTARRVPLNPSQKPVQSSINSNSGLAKPSRIPSAMSGLPRIASAPSRLPAPTAGFGSKSRPASEALGTTTRPIKPASAKRIL